MKRCSIFLFVRVCSTKHGAFVKPRKISLNNSHAQETSMEWRLQNMELIICYKTKSNN